MATMLTERLLIKHVYGNHAGNTLAETANVLQPCWQNICWNSKCMATMLAQHLLKQQVYCNHAGRTEAATTSVWKSCLHNTCWNRNWYNSSRISTDSARVLQAWLPNPSCFNRCCESECRRHNNPQQNTIAPVVGPRVSIRSNDSRVSWPNNQTTVPDLVNELMIVSGETL